MQYLRPRPNSDFVPGGNWMWGGNKLWKDALEICHVLVFWESSFIILVAFSRVDRLGFILKPYTRSILSWRWRSLLVSKLYDSSWEIFTRRSIRVFNPCLFLFRRNALDLVLVLGDRLALLNSVLCNCAVFQSVFHVLSRYFALEWSRVSPDHGVSLFDFLDKDFWCGPCFASGFLYPFLQRPTPSELCVLCSVDAFQSLHCLCWMGRWWRPPPKSFFAA